jgi:putative transposase
LRTDCDVKILYDGDTDRYQLLVPEHLEAKTTDEEDYVGIDPGVRTFMTCLTNNAVIKFGTNLDKTIEKHLILIDKINNNILLDAKTKKKRIKRHITRIQSIVEEVHWKTIAYLTDNYKTIAIGKFNISEVVNNKKSVLRKMTKRVGLMMSHYKFRERLIYKCKAKGVDLRIVNEYCTSVICSRCGNYKNDLGGNEIYDCNNCNTIMDRDVNGCRGILLKVIKEKN